jgi:hypothetical protein
LKKNVVQMLDEGCSVRWFDSVSGVNVTFAFRRLNN